MELSFDQLPSRVQELDRKIDHLTDLITAEEPFRRREAPDQWLTLELLAEYLGGLPRPTIYQWVRKKEIPHYRKGKRLYFSKLEIDKWVRGENHDAR